MSGLVSYLVNALSSFVFGPSETTETSMEYDPATSFYDADRYTPSIEDVIATKDTLFEQFKLPIELIDTIIDYAEYFPCTTMCRTGGELHVRAGGSGMGGHSEDRFLVRATSHFEHLVLMY